MPECKHIISTINRTKIMYPQLKYNHTHLLIVSLCLLSGCSSVNVQDDKNDICYTFRSQLRESEHYYTQSVVEGALIGGLIGAATGAATAAMSGGNIGAGAAIGGGVGAIAGGVGGYYNAKQKDIADEQALATSVRNDILTANGEIDRTSLAFAKLRDCRFAAAERIKSEFKAGRMPRDTAIKQLNALKVQFDEDIKIAGELGSKMSKQMTEFQDANNKILDKNPTARTVLYNEKVSAVDIKPEQSSSGKKQHTKKHGTGKKPTTPSTPVTVAKSPNKTPTTGTTKPATVAAAVEVAKVTETNQIKQKAFSDQVSQAKAQAKVAFSLEGSVSLLEQPETLLCGL
jgi:outer membrane lipoprotein SlyB